MNNPNMSTSKDKVTIITGTRKGIGKYLAHYYQNLGHQVIGCSRGKVDFKLDRYDHFELDVADEQSVVNMIRDVHQKYNKIDYLINNAGIASMNHCLLTPSKTVDRVLNTNIMGSFLFIREAAKVMSRHKTQGRIVNFSTVAVPMKLQGEAIYGASKAAIVTLTQILAKELAPFNMLTWGHFPPVGQNAPQCPEIGPQ
ncbi:MAG: SDR family oxidoreductase [Pseudomonadota bacterium]